MKAEEMFKELGYTVSCIYWDKYSILQYKDYICFTTICFYATNKSVSINNLRTDDFPKRLNRINKAIQQQIKELGWE